MMNARTEPYSLGIEGKTRIYTTILLLMTINGIDGAQKEDIFVAAILMKEDVAPPESRLAQIEKELFLALGQTSKIVNRISQNLDVGKRVYYHLIKICLKNSDKFSSKKALSRHLNHK